MPEAWNLFAIGRRSRDEDQLTEMLAWLVDAVPEVGGAIVRLAFDEPPHGSLTVTTQHGIAKGRLDALFIDSASALVVESKIDSGFGDDQVARYLEWLADTHGHKARRGLMTLTAHPAPWSAADVELADRLGVGRFEYRWEELHDVLDLLVESSDMDELSSRLISEFLDLLGEEGLVPMKPLGADEYAQWRDACLVVRRFHEFFSSCRDAIGDALGASPSATSKSANEGYVWQDFLYDDGSRIVVGVDCTDEERVARSAARRTAVLWMAVEATHLPDWKEAKDRLEATLPEGWSLWSRWWGERPRIGRCLDEVLGEGSFEEQRQRLATACAVGTAWLRGTATTVPAANTSSVDPSGVIT